MILIKVHNSYVKNKKISDINYHIIIKIGVSLNTMNYNEHLVSYVISQS